MAALIMSMPDYPTMSISRSSTLYSSAKTTSKYYHVKNVDEKGKTVNSGYLEIATSEIIFQYQHCTTKSMKWPLTCVRKFGTNTSGTVFIFEVGRRAPEGEGVYAFRTKKADEIRKVLRDLTQKF